MRGYLHRHYTTRDAGGFRPQAFGSTSQIIPKSEAARRVITQPAATPSKIAIKIHNHRSPFLGV
jgi:hypothetical protein